MKDYTQIADKIKSCADDGYICNAAVVEAKNIVFDPAFRRACEANTCGNYGRSWTCPPDVGDIDELIKQASSYKYAVVYQTIHPLEDSYDFEGMVEAGELHSKLSQKLSTYFDTLDFPKKLHLAAGGCRVCPVCAKRTMGPCRHPDKALASLEAYGVNVSALARACGMKYTNGQNTVTYFGALLFTPAECEG